MSAFTTLEAVHETGTSGAAKSSPVERPWHRVWSLVLAIELLVLYAPTVLWLFDRWTLSVWNSAAHGLLIPPVVAYFVYRELNPLRGLPRSASPWGFALLIPALVLHALDAGMHTQLLSAAAFMLLAIPGMALLFLGKERTRAIAFPLAFLAFSLPIPLAFTEQIHWQLRQVVAGATALVVPWLGIPIFVEGTTVHLANGGMEIADACSGFSTLYAATAIACLTAYTASSWRRRMLVLLSAAPIAIAANIVRVIALVVLIAWNGTEILNTFLHPLSGMLTFALALPVIFWLGGDSNGRERA